MKNKGVSIYNRLPDDIQLRIDDILLINQKIYFKENILSTIIHKRKDLLFNKIYYSYYCSFPQLDEECLFSQIENTFSLWLNNYNGLIHEISYTYINFMETLYDIKINDYADLRIIERIEDLFTSKELVEMYFNHSTINNIEDYYYYIKTVILIY
tara:strand:- start:2130 stop:2594 length:465 start_codon:yes stop_codon:yes gene_type:complete